MGEGGCVTTNNKKIYERLSRLRNHGIEKQKGNFFVTNRRDHPWYYEMQELGYHYRATDIQCALGISQLKKINKFLSKRRELAKKYDAAFREMKNAKPLQFNKRDLSSNHLYVLLIDFKKISKTRSDIMHALRKVGIITQVHYIPINHHPFYRKLNLKKLTQAENYYEKALSLPIFYDLKDKEQKHIIYHIKN